MLIQHKQTDGRGMFFIPGEEDEKLAELIYSHQQPDTLIAEHTEVSGELRGQNIGFQLVNTLVEHARLHHFKIAPVCPFVKSVFDKKPDFQDVLAQ
ncbi:MAG: GNAT family N-acetyltransferase [Chitinophagaceae bacterium]